MSKPHKFDLKALIAGEVAPASAPEPEPPPAPAPAEPPPPAPTEQAGVVSFKRPARRAAPTKAPKGSTLKERAHQLSLYLDPPVYDALREIAHVERTKLHPLILEAIDMLLKRRGSPSIKELTQKTG
jgi:hypothetical protein